MPKRSRAQVCASLTILLALFSSGAFPQAPNLKFKATAVIAGDERVITVHITNKGKEPAHGAKLTLVDQTGAPIVSALYSDNDLTVSPGERRVVEIRYPANLETHATIQVRGGNVRETSVRVSGVANPAYLPNTYPQPWQQPVTTPAPTVKSATVTLPKR